MTTRFLILEGCHGSGTTTHADALAEALRDKGFAASAYHHPAHPAGWRGIARVAWYAGARAEMRARVDQETALLVSMGDAALRDYVLARGPRVFVLDRGPLSSVAHLASLGVADPEPLTDLAAWTRPDVSWAVLTAPWGVLAARVAARGEVGTEEAMERRAWRGLAWEAGDGVVRFDTSRSREDVGADLLAWALEVLR